ncbi:hypothetical protein ABZ456_29285 [Streptomyces sp. NPDC005776]|uniref:hypothetical protein n=1 Tax=Streptomyces sp. NPDC005776 TaxID=3154676 RepID=UPI0033E45CA8
MTEVPQVRVMHVDLRGEAAVANFDSCHRYELAIDFTRSPDEIADALTDLFQEAINVGRWSRRGTGTHELATGTTEEAAPHPRNDLT